MKLIIDKIKSAFEAVKIGDIVEFLGFKSKCIFKYRSFIFWHRCPMCNSQNTFHEICCKLGIQDNTYKEERKIHQEKNRKVITLFKYNLCLECGREYVFETWINEVKEKQERTHYEK